MKMFSGFINVKKQETSLSNNFHKAFLNKQTPTVTSHTVAENSASIRVHGELLKNERYQFVDNIRIHSIMFRPLRLCRIHIKSSTRTNIVARIVALHLYATRTSIRIDDNDFVRRCETLKTALFDKIGFRTCQTLKIVLIFHPQKTKTYQKDKIGQAVSQSDCGRVNKFRISCHTATHCLKIVK